MPRRSAFAPHNLPPVAEDEECAKSVTLSTPPPPPPEDEKAPTAEELAEADAELARMEAALKASKAVASPIQQQRKTLEDDSSDSSSSEEEESRRWSTDRRGSRRSSVQHLSAKERRALRRLSQILRDGGESRRAQERRDSACLRLEQSRLETERRRLSERRRRMRSIAKLIDLSIVWEWLERIDPCDSDDEEETLEEQARRDTEAVAIVEGLAHSGIATAFGVELGLVFEDNACKHLVFKKLQDLHLNAVGAMVSAYDISTGYYDVITKIDSRLEIRASRTWRDFHRLRRGLVSRQINDKALPKLPRPRAMSEAKKIVRNVLAPAKKKGDRKWQHSKLPILDAWLSKVIALVATTNPDQAAASFKRSPAEEHLEDFLLKYANVSASR